MKHGMALLAVAILFLGCSLPRGTVLLRTGSMGLDGDVSAAGPGRTLSGSASVDSLGVDDREVILSPEVDLDWGPWHVAVDGFTRKFSGRGTADARLKVSGYPAIERGVAVDTDFRVDYLTGEVSYDVVPTDYVDLGPGLGVGLVSYDLDIAARGSSARVSLNDDLPVAYPMIRGAVEAGDFLLLGTVAGLSVSLGSDSVSFVEADIRAGWKFTGEALEAYGLFVIGYRTIAVDYDYEENGGDATVDVSLSGPYVGIAFSF